MVPFISIHLTKFVWIVYWKCRSNLTFTWHSSIQCHTSMTQVNDNETRTLRAQFLSQIEIDRIHRIYYSIIFHFERKIDKKKQRHVRQWSRWNYSIRKFCASIWRTESLADYYHFQRWSVSFLFTESLLERMRESHGRCTWMQGIQEGARTPVVQNAYNRNEFTCNKYSALMECMAATDTSNFEKILWRMRQGEGGWQAGRPFLSYIFIDDCAHFRCVTTDSFIRS